MNSSSIFVTIESISVIFPYEKGLFKVDHHNGSEAWYNSNGEASSPRSSLYDMGVEWGNIINSLF